MIQLPDPLPSFIFRREMPPPQVKAHGSLLHNGLSPQVIVPREGHEAGTWGEVVLEQPH